MAEIMQPGNPFSGLGSGTGGINPSRGLSQPQQQANPFGTLGSMLDIQSQQQQNELLQAQIAKAAMELKAQQQLQMANQAMGQMFQESFNPETGQPNWPQYFNQVLQNPLTMRYGAEVYAEGVKAQGLEASQAKTILEANALRADFFNQGALQLEGEFINRGQHVPTGAIYSVLMNGVSQGVFDKAYATSILAALPPEGPLRDAAIQRFGGLAKATKEQYEAVRGKIDTLDVGDRILTTRTTQDGTQILGPGIQKGMSPEDANRIVTIEGPEGETITGRNASVLPTVGGGGEAAPMGGGPQAQESPALGGSGTVSSPTLREKQLGEGRIKNFLTYEAEVQAAADAAASTQGLLKEAEGALLRTRTGGGSSYARALGEHLQMFGASDLADRLAGGKLEALQEVNAIQTLVGMRMFKVITEQPNRDLAQKEFERILGTTFSIDQDPKAAWNLLKLTENMMQLQVERSQALQQWVDAGRDPTKFRPAWAKAEKELISKGFLAKGTRQ